MASNKAEARRWYRRAAEQNVSNAMCHLGTMLVQGEGGPADREAGAHLWRRAAKLGNPKAEQHLQRLRAATQRLGR